MGSRGNAGEPVSHRCSHRSPERRAAAHGVRALLIRRGRHSPVVADELPCRQCRPGNCVGPARRSTGPRDVLDVDLAALASGEALGPGNSNRVPRVHPRTARHLLRRSGKPAVPGSASVLPERVWETSHIGGDRFAGNLLVLPHGAYFGQVEPEEATRVIGSFELGRLELDRYRGRARCTASPRPPITSCGPALDGRESMTWRSSV